MLRLTCKHLGETLASQVLRSLTLNINQHTISKEIPKLKAMAMIGDSGLNDNKVNANTTNISLLGTRELTIRCLTPIFDPSYRCTWSYVDGKSIRNGPKPVVPPAAWKADEELKKYLGRAVGCMTGVSKVRWVRSNFHG